MARPAKPLALIDLTKNHITAAEIEGRKANTPSSGQKNKLKCPSGMSEAGAKEWRRIVKLYKEAEKNSGFDFVDDLDESLLASYCESYAVWKGAQRDYQTLPLVQIVDGKYIENPYLIVMDREVKKMVSLADKLCLSPVGRAKLGLARTKAQAQVEDPMAALLGEM